MTPANLKTYELVTFLESNNFKFPHKRGELIVSTVKKLFIGKSDVCSINY